MNLENYTLGEESILAYVVEKNPRYNRLHESGLDTIDGKLLKLLIW